MTKYSVLVADPPWQFEDKLGGSTGMARKKGTIGVRRSAESKYDVMPLADIMALPVRALAAPDAILALWCPNTLLETHGFPTMRAWGFEYKQLFTWVKTTNDRSRPRPGMGRIFRNASEPALIGKIGRPSLQNLSQLGVSLDPWQPKKGHSEKPETLQDRLDVMYPDGPRLELFARRDRPGWTCTGLQCPSTLGVDIRDWLATQTGAKRVA
jgi:N6-adenosine-specific RNA methylase IME4